MIVAQEKTFKIFIFLNHYVIFSNLWVIFWKICYLLLQINSFFFYEFLYLLWKLSRIYIFLIDKQVLDYSLQISKAIYLFFDILKFIILNHLLYTSKLTCEYLDDIFPNLSQIFFGNFNSIPIRFFVEIIQLCHKL